MTNTTYTVNAAGTGDVHADRHAWKSNTNHIAVTDSDGRIVAWYERKREYRCVTMFADFLVGYRIADRQPVWERFYEVPSWSDARNLREFAKATMQDRYGVKVAR